MHLKLESTHSFLLSPSECSGGARPCGEAGGRHSPGLGELTLAQRRKYTGDVCLGAQTSHVTSLEAQPQSVQSAGGIKWPRPGVFSLLSEMVTTWTWAASLEGGGHTPWGNVRCREH